MALTKQRKETHEALDGGIKQREGLTGRAYRQLHQMILTLELEPGSIHSELDLSERLGIGRTPIREALARLSREHLVIILPRNGALITEIEVSKQMKMLEIRRELTRVIVRSVARHATSEDCDELREANKEIRKAVAENDIDAFFHWDGRIKEVFLRCAKNEFITPMMWITESLSRRFWYNQLKNNKPIPFDPSYREKVIEAVIKGDAELAAKRHDQHFDMVEKATLATLMLT